MGSGGEKGLEAKTEQQCNPGHGGSFKEMPQISKNFRAMCLESSQAFSEVPSNNTSN